MKVGIQRDFVELFYIHGNRKFFFSFAVAANQHL